MLRLSCLQNAEVLHSNLQRAEGMFCITTERKQYSAKKKRLHWLVLKLKHGVLIQFSTVYRRGGRFCSIIQRENSFKEEIFNL